MEGWIYEFQLYPPLSSWTRTKKDQGKRRRPTPIDQQETLLAHLTTLALEQTHLITCITPFRPRQRTLSFRIQMLLLYANNLASLFLLVYLLTILLTSLRAAQAALRLYLFPDLTWPLVFIFLASTRSDIILWLLQLGKLLLYTL